MTVAALHIQGVVETARGLPDIYAILYVVHFLLYPRQIEEKTRCITFIREIIVQ